MISYCLHYSLINDELTQAKNVENDNLKWNFRFAQEVNRSKISMLNEIQQFMPEPINRAKIIET